MKLGLVARSEDRGLGVLSVEVFRHLHPDRTLIVMPDAVQKAGLTSHVDRFPGADQIRLPSDPSDPHVGQLDERACRRWLDGLDVVLFCESVYDWRFCQWAAEAGVATVGWVMPEFARPEWLTQPTQWWAPTGYRLKELPPSTRVVPVPIATDRWQPRPVDGPPRWLHVAGAQTIADRNGTRALVRALRYVHSECHVTITTQTDLPYTKIALPTNVDLRVVYSNFADYWDLYDLGDVLLFPRRYAGLSLVALEAMGAGLAVVMTDLPPQNVEWPVKTVRTSPGTPIRLIGGLIETGDIDQVALAALIDAWAADPGLVTAARERSADYALDHSWDALEPLIRAELARAVTLIRG